MKIIVCIKQVPDTNEVTINPETNTLNRVGVPSIINPFDKFALELALRLKEQHNGTVTALTMGPPQARDALKECYAMGADEIVLLSDKYFGGADTLATSYTLAAAIRKIGGYDLIFCGKQAIDGDTAQVGTGIAEWLDLPQVVCGVDIKINGDKAVVKKELDATYERIELPLPAVVTISKTLDFRSPNLMRRMKASKMEIPVWKAEDLPGIDMTRLGLKGSPTKVGRIFAPTPRDAGIKVQGQTADEAARGLIDYLLNAKVI